MTPRYSTPQTFRLNGRQVSAECHAHAKSLVNGGGKAFFVCGDVWGGGCDNCNGYGQFHIQYVVGGPFASIPPTSAHNDATITLNTIDGQMYQCKTKGYQCPVCGGVSQADVVMPKSGDVSGALSSLLKAKS